MQTTRDRQAYLRDRKDASVTLYFRDLPEKDRLQSQASAAGYRNFNQWILQMVAQATSGQVYPVGFVEDLQKELTKLRAWVEQKDEQLHELHQERATLLRQRADLLLTVQGVAALPEEVEA